MITATRSLAELQQRFQRHLLDPTADALVDLVADTTQVPRTTRLFIYSNAYRVRLVEAMSADFGNLHRYLGDEEFDRLIRAYLNEYPSRYFTLRWFGSDLARFLRDTVPYCEHPDLAELAEFEWALCHAFDAADAPTAEVNTLATLPAECWSGLALQLHPSLRLLTLAGNAPGLWEAMNEECEPPAYVVLPSVQSWAVWRHDLRLLFRPLDADEAWALTVFQAGQTFADVCAELLEWHTEEAVPMRAVQLLQQWLGEGLIAGIVAGEPSEW